MTGHTPGPWHQGGISYAEHVEDGVVTHTTEPTTSIYGPRAAPDHQSGPCVARDVRLADAPLIAAAPETAAERDRLREQNAAMLEALKAAVPKLQAYYIATLDRGIGVQIDTIVVQCQRVITEAEAGND